MQDKTLFLLTITTILLLFIITNITQTSTIIGKIQTIKYYENLCKITLQDNQEILAFTNQILNIRKGDNIQIQIKQNNHDLIAEKITKQHNK